MRRRLGLLLSVYISLTALIGCARTQATPAILSLNPAITYQTMNGWEAVAEVGALSEVNQASGHSNINPAFPRYKDALFDQAVNDLGLNRIRLEVYSGVENSTDYFAQYLNGQIGYRDWADHRQEIVNDNNDPNVINPNGFHFSGVDFAVDNVVLPLKQRLAARGERLIINATYVDFQSSPFEHKNNPAEYAEFVLATYQHLQAKYGWVPDTWEVILEPDNSQWSAQQVGAAIAAAAARLQANGFTPRFTAPSTVNMANVASYFDTIRQTPGALAYLSELSYHRYQGVSDSALQAIVSRAQQYGLHTAMLEYIGADYQELHTDLKVGRNSAWQQFTLAYPTEDNGAQYYWIDQSDPQNPQVNLGSRTRYLRQYFKYVRAGAVRIEATSTTIDFDPLAFINTDGKYVVVVKAIDRADLSVQGLPPGVYGIKYTTAHEYDVNLSDVNLAAGQLLSARMPEPGVMTIYAKTAPVAEATPTRTPLPTFTLTPPPTPSRTPTLRPPTDEDYRFYLPYILAAGEPPDRLAAPVSQMLLPCGKHG